MRFDVICGKSIQTATASKEQPCSVIYDAVEDGLIGHFYLYVGDVMLDFRELIGKYFADKDEDATIILSVRFDDDDDDDDEEAEEPEDEKVMCIECRKERQISRVIDKLDGIAHTLETEQIRNYITSTSQFNDIKSSFRSLFITMILLSIFLRMTL